MSGELNKQHVPAWGLIIQGIWAGVLVLPRTVKIGRTRPAPSQVGYGNLYGNLLDYVISAALIFYILTIIGIFVLRRKRPDAERPYKAFGYPIVPALYIARRKRDSLRAVHVSDGNDVAGAHHRTDRRADLFSVEKIKRACAVRRPKHLAKPKPLAEQPK